MRKQKIKYYAGAVVALALGITCFAGNAQKLPIVQKTGLLAPATVKVDGKATEWDDTFQAYNKSTDIYYSIANNADNLYIVVQATKTEAITKIFAGGITLTIKNADKKNGVAAITITYPLFPPHTNPGTSKLNSDGVISDPDLDALNKKITDNVKEILVTGIKEIPDSMVSVYNDKGILSAELINNKKIYTCEMAIPLKYLVSCIDATSTFAYNVKLNGMQPKNITGTINGQPITSANSAQVSDLITKLMNDPNAKTSGNGPSLQSLMSPTDFSGTYTLVKQ